MEQQGFFWHMYHDDRLLSFCYGYAHWAKTITKFLPPQQELRLRLFQQVSGQLPQEVVDAGEDLLKAATADRLAFDAKVEAEKAPISTQDLDELRKVRSEKYVAYSQSAVALFGAMWRHRDEIKALHAQECLDCPWDGHTILSAALAAA